MLKQEFSITIDAPREKVWDTLWNDTYNEWTAVFSEGSHAKTDWQKGSQVLFLNSNNDGMVSVIADKIPNEYMSFRHMGEVHKGVIDMDSPQVKQWAGSEENYTLKNVNGKTELLIDMDLPEEHREYFLNTWPKALDRLKELAERRN